MPGPEPGFAAADANAHQEIGHFVRGRGGQRGLVAAGAGGAGGQRRAADLAHRPRRTSGPGRRRWLIADGVAHLDVDDVVLVHLHPHLHVAEVGDAHDLGAGELGGADHPLPHLVVQHADGAVHGRVDDGLAQRVAVLAERAFRLLNRRERGLLRWRGRPPWRSWPRCSRNPRSASSGRDRPPGGNPPRLCPDSPWRAGWRPWRRRARPPAGRPWPHRGRV